MEYSAFNVFVYATILWCISKLAYGILYRLYLGPLAAFPGPTLAALTYWYEFYHDIIHRGQYIWRIREMHEKYGPIVRINPHEIHISDPEFYDKLYTNNKPAHKWEWQTQQFGVPGSLISTNDHETHRMRRGVLNQFFSMQRARELQPLIQERADALIKRFMEYQGTGKFIQLENACAALANDIVMEYSFARHDHRVEAPEFDPSWFRDSNGSVRMSPLWRYFNLILRLILSLPPWILSHLSRGLAGLARTKDGLRRQIESIRAAPKNPQTTSLYSTVFQELLDSKLSQEEKATPRLTDEAILLIAAGTGTVAWTLSIATFHLLSNPAILRRLKEELETVDPEAHGHVPLATLQALPYFTAVMNETLRLSYGTTHRFQRIFSTPLTYTPSASTQSSKEWAIPPNTPISMSTVHLHHNESVFPESHTFNPSRWLKDPSLTRYQMAFSKGSRRCLGINLAYAELYTVLAAVFVKFGSNEVQGKKDKGILELAGTTQEDVEIWGDTFVAMQKPGSIGVRIIVKTRGRNYPFSPILSS